MSFSSNGVTFKNTKWIQNRIYKLLFRGAEGILSVLFVISMAAPMVFPNHAQATAGVSSKLSYQGRLTDANGSPYTGTYYVCFSIYDAVSAGTKLWPTGVPASNTVTVTNGVFDIGVGVANALDFDFSTNDTVYLNVGVSASNVTCDNGAMENLTPRQRMDATPYARVAASVWGALLKTDITNSRVQVGAGTGTGSPIWLNLDWKNTPTTLGANCSTVSATNGAVWYNSSGTRALACINNVIVGVDNASEIASLNIGGNTAGTPATITSGAVTLAGGTNITLSQAGNVVTVVGPYVHNVTLGGNSTSAGAGYVQISSGTMLLAGGNNITLSQNGNSVTISGQPAHGVVIASGVGGGTAGVTASISSGYMTLAGGNNITLSQNGNAITISAGAGGGGGVAIAGGTSTATNGTVIFSNANGVSFGLNNGTMTASAAGGGGGGVTVSHWPPSPVGLVSLSNYTGATGAGTNITASFHVAPLQLEQAVSFSRANIVGSFATVAGTGSVSIARMLGIYTLNGGTALSLSTSFMFRHEISQSSVTAQSHRWYWGTNSTSNSSSAGGNISANYTGYRVLPVYVSGGGMVLSAGQYYIAFAQTNRSSGANIMPAASIMYISQSQSSLGGQLGSAATIQPFTLIGQFSSTTAVGNFTTPFMPVSINTTAITGTGGSSQWKWPYVNFLGK